METEKSIEEQVEERVARARERMEQNAGAVALPVSIVKVRFGHDTVEGREYTYFAEEPLNIRDNVIVPTKNSDHQKATVSTINVPESEIEAFRDKIRTIPAGSEILTKRRQAGIKPEQDEMEDGLNAEGLTLAGATDYGKMAEESAFLNEPDTETAVAVLGRDSEALALHEAGLKMLEYAKAMSIVTLEDAKIAASELTSIGTIKKGMEAKKEEYLAPRRAEVKSIQALYSDLLGPILEAEANIRAKQTAFLLFQKKKQEEQEEINRLRYEAAQKDAALHSGEISESVNEIPIEEAPRHARGDIGTSGLVDHWTYEIEDISLLPPAYMVPDTVLLGDTAKKYHDQKPVPGVRFFNKPYLSNRRA